MATDDIGRAFLEALTQIQWDEGVAEWERDQPYTRPGSDLFLNRSQWRDYDELHAPRKRGVWGDGRPVTDEDRRRTWAKYQEVLAAHRPRRPVYASMTEPGHGGGSLAALLILGYGG